MSQSQSVPLSLFHAGRAQCPDCGAAVALVDHQPFVKCQYCGGTAIVERRLRTIEPVISVGFITADAPLDSARQIKPSHIINAVAQDESHCPTCGSELEAAQTQAIRLCPYCKTQSKVERRLLRSPEADEALAAMERDADQSEQRQFAQTEALIAKAENKDLDLADRMRAAHELGEYWSHSNARAARLLPRVMEVMRTCDPRLEIPLGELVGKLLCNNDVVLSNAVLRAAEKFTFDVNGSLALLVALGLGSGVGCKLLLDTADYASSRDANEYACCALWAVNTMMDRNYAGRMRLAEIVLYRLLYLRGPVQAWAIQLAQGQGGMGCRFPTPTLLHFMDDCAAERPELVGQIDKCFYDGRPATEGDYIIRLEYLNKLITPPAKRAALEHAFTPPAEASDKSIAQCLQTLLSLTTDPYLGATAIKSIADLIDEDPEPRECVHALVRAHGDALPEDIRLAYLRKIPKTPLLTPLPAKNRNYDTVPPTAFEKQLEEWKNLWIAGINQAVDHFHARQHVAWDYWKQIAHEKPEARSQ